MSNYSKTTDFAAKDSLPSGDSGKIIRGSEFETEFDAISTAIATKADAADPTFTGTVTIDGLTVNGNTVLGNAATDTVTVTADIASNLIPSADDTYDLGAVGAEWNDLHVDGVAYIDTIDGAATSGDFTFTGASYNAVWDTSDNALEFADSAKATFGATGDLQIYHSGTHSFITDVGTGNLYLRGTNLLLTSAAGETYADFTADGAARLYHNGSAKLATTSTGIDVTGTVTADGLTVSASSNALITIADSTLPTIQKLDLQHNAGASSFISGNNGAYGTINLQAYNGTSTVNRLAIGSGGDISFYEDTGTTAKFFWDASTESLGIGTSSPDITGFAESVLTLAPSGTNTQSMLELAGHNNASDTFIGGLCFINQASTDPAGTGGRIGQIAGFRDAGDNEAGSMLFWTSGTGGVLSEAMRIDSSGRVGIGTDSPDTLLEVVGADPILTIRDSEFSQSATNATLRLAESGGSDTLGNYWDINHTANGQLRFVQDKDGFNTERMRIDSSGNVGIGTDSPSRLLHVRDTSSQTVAIFDGGSNGAGEIGFRASGTSGDTYVTIGAVANDMVLSAGANERMRIDSSGNVGIGTSSPDAKLVVSEGGTTAAHGDTDLLVRHSQVAGATAQVQILAGNTANSNLYFSDTDSYSVGGFQYNHSSNYLAVRANNSERMRIDSSGNVLVGKTSADAFTTVGHELHEDGLMVVTRSGGTVGLFNRSTNDGTIVDFRKDNATVGTIGTQNGQIIIGSADTGLGFQGDSTGTVDDAILPVNISTGARRDAAINLGHANGRFKDLYLSGGAYLGGTAAANKLDDYEEGTFTVTTASDATGVIGNETGTYTKVGDLVFIDIAFNVTTNFTSNTIGGLPFTASVATTSSSVRPMQVMINNAIGTARYQNGQTTLKFLDASGNVVNPSTTDSVFRISGVYRAS